MGFTGGCVLPTATATHARGGQRCPRPSNPRPGRETPGMKQDKKSVRGNASNSEEEQPNSSPCIDLFIEKEILMPDLLFELVSPRHAASSPAVPVCVQACAEC